jgi:hypothetical protein
MAKMPRVGESVQIGQTATGTLQIIVEELIEARPAKTVEKQLAHEVVRVPALPLFCVLSALCIGM